MPPSGRKGKTRARRAPAAEPKEASDAEAPDALATPSKASRKRARVAEAAAPAPRNTRRKTKDTRAHEREDTEGLEEGEPSDAETEPALPTDEEIIQNLRVADRQVNATEDYANDLLEGQENVPGYGKIAGRDWAFIIRKVEINIGRPEAHEKLPVDGSGESGPSARTVVDIDLGPDRQVSRSHAIISYDPDAMQWFIVVGGRNGLRADNHLLKRGAKSYLRSGSVIEIANTQMAFITTPTEESVGPQWDASIVRQAQKSSEGSDNGEDGQPHNNTRSHAHPTANGQVQDATRLPPTSEFGGSQYRTHPHSQRAAMAAPPGTPMRSQQVYPKSSPAANYARGVMMESTESIDYSADNAKDLKPPHSYAQLIGMAILSTHEQQMTLNNIYKWIMANYAFYRFNTGGWQNSIRHNLSLNKAFTKIARRTDEPGKGMKWMIEPTEFDNFVSQGMKGCRRPQPLPGTQSTFGSPSSPMLATRNGAHTRSAALQDGDVTPPVPYPSSYPTATEAFTPERGSRRTVNGQDVSVGLGINSDGAADLDYLTRSTPRNGLTVAANAAGSPPALYINDEHRAGPMDTPFPLRPTQRFAPPSTLRRPSDFIQFSSPAPFWKMEGLVGSTPFKPYDLSPLKTPFSLKKTKEEGKNDDEADGADSEQPSSANGEKKEREPASPVIHSSSPPPRSASHDMPISPTLSRPATAVAKTLTEMAASAKSTPVVEQAPNTTSTVSGPLEFPEQPLARASPTSGPNGMVAPAHAPPTQAHHIAAHSNGYHDDGEDEGIDLVKGFQPIGAFHQRNHMALTSAFGR